MSCTVIILAAGFGTRFGGAVPKQFIKLGGIPVIVWTLRIFKSIPEIQSVIIPANKEWHDPIRKMISDYQILKNTVIVEGGEERQDSVMNALQEKTIKSDIILVHDAVRPFASPELFKNIIAGVLEFGAAIPVLQPKDTIKQINSKGFIEKTLDRTKLWNVQTPQGFKREMLFTAYSKAKKDGIKATDDASLVEHAGYSIKAIEGEEMNIKITSKFDRKLAEVILSEMHR